MDLNSTINPPAGPMARSSKALWVVIGVLSIAVAALGGALVHKEVGNTSQPQATSLTIATPVRAPDDFKPAAVQAPSDPPPTQAALATTLPPPPVRAPQVIPPNTAAGSPAQVAPAGEGAAPPAHKVCSVCGHVESVRTIKHQKPTTGVGAVAGGVVGGVLGNQIGSGNGRTLATVAGAVGGGFAGNEIEKRTHTETVYQVSVRMDDGTLRTVETHSAPPVGKAVTLKNNVLRPANGQK
ncbi:Glycine zipper 2TM domain-containing protein [Variovorax sp. HW608]|uniref:glycine zipper 2TM domain-containing protein n=1 Tax=Variovorax sp. HW608 TaxID=1034889 RepID=UPI00081FFAC7|nr:glycine zipper 2TM domain-containing protein [Variovorax sp. HW608]SCK61406.1 Glycine zipper 2TM domain-containing protein [Variovorax sp. HW608]